LYDLVVTGPFGVQQLYRNNAGESVLRDLLSKVHLAKSTLCYLFDDAKAAPSAHAVPSSGRRL
jgi:hypothetical protein